MPVLLPHVLIDERVSALQQAHEDAGIPRAELDLSGGIDSAVMACLLVKALGPENVTLVHSNISTSSEQTTRAVNLANALGCPLVNVYLDHVYNLLLMALRRSLAEAGYSDQAIADRMAKDPTICGSIRSTLRAPVGRACNRLTGGGIRHGTGNEDEDRFLRFYQKGGDGEVDSNPIEFLSKGEVYQLALALTLHLPVASAMIPIIKAVPTPDLWGAGAVAHSDEAELQSWLGAPLTYSRIDLHTGQYAYVGTIERVNRFADFLADHVSGLTPSCRGEALLFDPEDRQDTMREVMSLALIHPAFRGCLEVQTPDEMRNLLRAARRAERVTRHKLNPNIPAYGQRQDLLQAGILTNDIPLVV